MKARNVVAIAVALGVVLFMDRPVRAQNPLIGVDGCAILATLVYTEISRAGSARGPGRALEYPGRDEVTICNHTARTVTRAFSKSLQNRNIYISWTPGSPSSGDYCNSHYLSQCYPDSNPYMPPLSDGDYAFMMKNWRAIMMALAPTMTPVSSGSVSRFEQSDLRLGIRRSLQRQHGVVRLA